MLSKKRVTALAKRLAQLSFNGAEIDRLRVQVAVEWIEECAEMVRGSLRRKYLHFLENECHWRLLRIEYAGECDFIPIQRSMEQHVGRTLKLETAENVALIAGLRISVGDCIWERSIQGDLSTLCS
ncbi:MAG: F0F1 ATP synthase subunit delta [Puniceicoccales bacterium]|jgi:F-type H+-transporting ATPase subunit delta|nr:F0F1 ATP synthase subunit delta [Puniceicoccales bacterium]